MRGLIISPKIDSSINVASESNSPPPPAVNRAKPPPRPETGPKRLPVAESIFDDCGTPTFPASTQLSTFIAKTENEEMLLFNSSDTIKASTLGESSASEEIFVDDIIGGGTGNPSPPQLPLHAAKKVDLLGLFEMEPKQPIIENVAEIKTNIRVDDLSSLLNSKDGNKKSSISSTTSSTKPPRNDMDAFASILTSFSDNNHASSSSLSSMGKNGSNNSGLH